MLYIYTLDTLKNSSRKLNKRAMMALSLSQLSSVENYTLSIISNIKFEHRICLHNTLKKCHDLGHLSLSLNGANQINMSNFDKKKLP
jgi:hypothetical protein